MAYEKKAGSESGNFFFLLFCFFPKTWVGRAMENKTFYGVGLISYSKKTQKFDQLIRIRRKGEFMQSEL